MRAVQIHKGFKSSFKVRTRLGQVLVGSPMRGYGGSSLLEFTHNRWSLTQPWKKRRTSMKSRTWSTVFSIKHHFGLHIKLSTMPIVSPLFTASAEFRLPTTTSYKNERVSEGGANTWFGVWPWTSYPWGITSLYYITKRWFWELYVFAHPLLFSEERGN